MDSKEMLVSIDDDSMLLYDRIRRGMVALDRTPCSICREPETKLPRLHFHGSDWGACRKKVMYECFFGHEDDRDPRWRTFLFDGHFHEYSIVSALRTLGYRVRGRGKSTEFRLEEHITVDGTDVHFLTVGHTDGLIGEDNAVLECKAVKDWAWKNKFKKSQIPQTYYGQIQCYLHHYQSPYGFLVVKNRHDSDILPPFKISYDEEYVKNRLHDLGLVYLALTGGRKERKAVKKPYKTPGDECRFCAFKSRCW